MSNHDGSRQPLNITLGVSQGCLGYSHHLNHILLEAAHDSFLIVLQPNLTKGGDRRIGVVCPLIFCSYS
jgi:hypothetical protein